MQGRSSDKEQVRDAVLLISIIVMVIVIAIGSRA